MTIDQISVFVENKPGKLAEVVEALASENIDMRALSIVDTSSFGILRLIVNKPALAQKVLRDAGCLVTVNEVIPVAVSDTPGGLALVLRVLSEHGIGVEYAYAFVAHKQGQAYVVLRVEDNDFAIKTLEEHGIKLLTAEEMYA